MREGARPVVQQAIETELSALLERFKNVKTLHGQRAVVRNGYPPEREGLTAAGPMVKVPKISRSIRVGCEVLATARHPHAPDGSVDPGIREATPESRCCASAVRRLTVWITKTNLGDQLKRGIQVVRWVKRSFLPES